VSLPKGWAAVNLRDVAEFIMGQAPPGADCNTEGVGTPFVKAGEFGRERPLIREWTTRPLKFAEERDLLICVVGATAGKLNRGADCAIGRSVAAIRPTEATSTDFLYPRMKSEVVRLRSGSTGTAQGVISREMLGEVPIALPPAAEQCRIVAKLDTLFARLAGARAELERVPILVRRTKEQVLTVCFTEAGPSKSDLGTLLLRIESGKNMRCEERPPRDGELGVVKVSAVTWGHFDSQESKTLPSDYNPPEKARIRAGDLLISRANTLELVGAVVLVDSEPRGLFLSDKILRLVVEEDMKKWVLWFLRSSFGRGQIESLATGNQLSMRNISQDALRRIRIPNPSAEIRSRLIEKVEAAFVRADRLEAEAARARALLDRLEVAILAKAFRGELVPQDPNDEPAIVLLERTRAARSQLGQSQPKRSRKASAPKVPREKAVMTKSRQDEDVKNKPYLANIIREAGGSSKVEDLFSKADLPVTDFYKQLAWEVDRGHIRDKKNQILQAA
jgi:type I restriction enzyme S subunit